MGVPYSVDTLGLLGNASNVEFVSLYFRFNLISQDPDDNKFVDCSIAANADYIVTHDSDFNVLKKIAFPKVQVIDTTKFKEILGI